MLPFWNGMKIEGGGIITFGEHSIEFSFRRSSRAKRTSLTVYPNGRLVATIPQRASEYSARRLILKERVWVLKSLEKIRNKKSISFPCVQKKELTSYKKKSKEFIEKRVKHYNALYNFPYNRITIRNQKSQWGSCSEARNLNFNYRLLFLPAHLADYVIVHELCHLEELNHSKRFWRLVWQAIPEYKKREKELKIYVLT